MIDLNTNITIKEDVFESFVGALVVISRKLDGMGMDYINAYKFIRFIFDKIPIDINNITNDPKTWVRQTFERMGWGEIIENEAAVGDILTFSLKLTPAAIAFAKANNLNLPEVIGMASGNINRSSEKTIATTAYEQGVTNLMRGGITRQWVLDQLENRDRSDPTLQNAYITSEQRLKKEGYDRMKFITNKSTRTVSGSLMQLIGIKDATREYVILASVFGKETSTNQKLNLLLQYR